jgi:hypothetical protein
MKGDEEKKKKGQTGINSNRMCWQGKLVSCGCAAREGTSEKPMKIASSNIRLQNKGKGVEKTRCIKRATI